MLFNFTSHLIPSSARVRKMSLRIADSQLRGILGPVLVFSFYFKVIALHTLVWNLKTTKNHTVLHKDKYLDQWTNWEFRNEPIHLWSFDLQQGSQEFNGGKNNVFNKWYWTTKYPYAGECSWTLTDTIYKHEIKTDGQCICESWNSWKKTYRLNPHGFGLDSGFLDMKVEAHPKKN